MTLEELRKILRKCWSKETTDNPGSWTPENPAWGQCAVTALVVQDFFGGEILKARAETEKNGISYRGAHYWNQLPDGQKVDLTSEQLPSGTVISEERTIQRDNILNIPQAKARYTLLKMAVENQIKCATS